jgi:serine/threonine-protein kinase RsbW
MRPNDQDVAERRRRGAGPAVGGMRLAALTLPLSGAHVSLARLATAQVAGALNLSVGRVADLRLAVDEACGQFLLWPAPLFDGADADADAVEPLDVPLEVCFDRLPGKLRITVSGPVPAAAWPDRESLGWLVLEAIVSDLRHAFGPRDGVGTLTIVEPLSTDEASRDALWFAAL